ncbi:MAG: TlpA family protein disulfide reductase [Bacteroidales bacterium]|nr:TlpA family protein disulfide reductase [Bacteroidales bacterium]
MNKHIFPIIAVVLATACAVSCGNRQKKAEAEPVAEETQDMSKYMPDLKAGEAAPALEMNTPEGVTLSLADFAGQWVVLDFWASWCPDCREEFPAVKELYNEFSPKGVKILGVSFDHEADAWNKCLEEQGFEWPQVSNLIKWKENPVSEAFGIHWIPTMVLVGPDGNIAGAALTAKDMKALLYSKL